MSQPEKKIKGGQMFDYIKLIQILFHLNEKLNFGNQNLIIGRELWPFSPP